MDRHHLAHRSGPGWARRGMLFALVLLVTLGEAGPIVGSSFEGQGRITAVDVGRGTITIEHGGVPGLLPATRTEFPVAEDSLMRAVRPGDQAHFALAARDEFHGLLAIVSLGPEASARWPLDRVLVAVGIALVLSALVAPVVGGLALYRTVQALHRRVVALDHEVAMLRIPLSDTHDGVQQIARALEDAALIL